MAGKSQDRDRTSNWERVAQSGSKISIRGGRCRLGRLEWKGSVLWVSACCQLPDQLSFFHLLLSLASLLPSSIPSPPATKRTAGARPTWTPWTSPKLLGAGSGGRNPVLKSRVD